MATSLTQRFRRRVYKLYTLFMCFMIFSVYWVYHNLFREILQYPEMQTLKFYQQQFSYQPKTLSFVIFCLCLYSFSLVGSFYIIMSVIFGACWKHVKPYCPIRIRRKTFCFCKCARRRLRKIVMSIHESQCNWPPTHLNNLDDVTRKCILLVTDGTHKTLNCKEIVPMLVGSSAEGLGKSFVLDLKNSYRDQWCRFLLRFFCCCLPCNTSFTSLRTDIDVIMKFTEQSGSVHSFTVDEQSNKNPGFVKLILNSEKLWRQYSINGESGKTYLSSALIRKAVYEAVDLIDENCLPASRIFGPFKHPPKCELESIGPAAKLTISPIGQVWFWNENQKFVIFEADFIFGIHCHRKWPTCAAQWLSRHRYWPFPADVAYISSSGFIIVAKASKTSSRETKDLEWLVSFPHCETYLGQLIPQVAKACYLALKIMFKDHLSYYCENLKTYQLKTLLFWELEKHPLEFWSTTNVKKCFMCLLDSLMKSVARQDCPSYWIENHNLFMDCDPRELVQLYAFLRKVRSYPAPYIEDVGSLWC